MSRGLPYHKLFGRIVGVSFLAGGAVELFMIYVRIGSETFYDTAKRKELERRPERRRKNEEFRQMMMEGEQQQTQKAQGHDAAGDVSSKE